MPTRKCGHRYHLTTGNKDSCDGTWCHNVLFGGMDRATTHVLAHSPALSALAGPPDASGPAQAVWHIRTGDISLPLSREAATAAKAAIERGFPRRGVEHTIVTFKRSQLHAEFPWLPSRLLAAARVLDSQLLQDRAAFAMMLRADVLVSTGSSFPQLAAAFSPPGRQLHLAFPSKGQGQGQSATLSENASQLSASYFRSRPDFKSFFVRRNAVPLDLQGRPFPEYDHKMARMFDGLDARDAADEATANLAYEYWF